LADDFPTRGELWLIRLPRALGAELQRDRPAVVISSPALDAVPVRIVVPLTTWCHQYEGRINKLRVEANDWNGLHAESAADVLQVRSVSTERFLSRIGVLGLMRSKRSRQAWQLPSTTSVDGAWG